MIKMFNNLRWVIFIFIALFLMGMKTETNRLVDPTQPPLSLMPADSAIPWQKLTLGAIFIKSNAKTAVINGESYNEGDNVGEYIITNITDNTVELLDSSKQKEVLHLVTNVKKAVSNKEE